MSSTAVALIPPRRRDALFAEIRQLVNETDAVDRSLAGVGEGLAVDECLEEIADLLAGECRRARKTAKSVA